MIKIELLIVALCSLSSVSGFQISRNIFSSWIRSLPNSDNEIITSPNRIYKFRPKMSMMVEKEETKPSKKEVNIADFSIYSIGQQYEGTIMTAKQYGVFVDISTGVNVLLPRSLMSRGSFEKLKKLADSKAKDLIKLELVGVSAENRTLSGKYLSGSSFQGRADISSLEGKDLANKFFNATVVSAHEFGVFAEIEEFGVEGLVPASKLPEKMSGSSIASAYPAGTSIMVKIEEINVEGKKLVLSMKSNRADVSAFQGVGSDKWIQGVVQSVSNFGLFVRPAGYDSVGLVHNSRVPRDLISALKKKVTIPSGQNKTDIESLFSEGDVIKIRVESVAVGSRKLELSMLPYRSAADDEDDYVVEGRDPEGEEGKNNFEDITEDEVVDYNAEDTLLWWRGAPYVKSSSGEEVALDEEIEVINESSSIVEGTWRRMFEIDLREDAADFSSKALDAELKELEDEIGELSGLDEDMIDAPGFGTRLGSTFGSFIPPSFTFPSDWKDQMDFFKDLEATETTIKSKLRGGKASEQSEFDNLLKEVELELQQVTARSAPKSTPITSSAVETETAVVVPPPAAEEEVPPPAADAASA